MQSLNEALRTKQPNASKPQAGQRGTRSDWHPIGILAIMGSHLQIVSRQSLDPRDGGAAVEVAPGTNVTVEGQFLNFGSDKRIARVRAYPNGAAVMPGAQLGTVRSDIGGIVVCDGDLLASWRADDEDALGEWTDDVLNDWMVLDQAGMMACEPADTTLIYVDGGFGDGRYSVVALEEGGRLVGLQCEFLSDDAVYPFNQGSK